MPLSESLLGDWSKHRQRLKREIRILVVDGDSDVRNGLDRLLYKHRISCRTISAAGSVMDLVGRGHYTIVIISDALPEMRDLGLARQIRAAFPEVDVIITSPAPGIDLICQAFLTRILDILTLPPFDESGPVGGLVTAAVARNVNRRMRTLVLGQLRDELRALDSDGVRPRTIALLERRLAEFKRRMGTFDSVVVAAEEQAGLRLLSENLLVEGMNVETTEDVVQAVDRVSRGGINLFVAGQQEDASKLLARIHEVDPLVELMVFSGEPEMGSALSALRGGLALYQRWPHPDPAMVVQSITRRMSWFREERLMDNLLDSLFQETRLARGQKCSAEDRRTFRDLVGITRDLLAAAEPPPGRAVTDAVVFLDNVLDQILNPDQELSWPEGHPGHARPVSDEAGGHERRSHFRIPENQFIRFHVADTPTSTLAYMGDLSEGGLFVRTTSLLERGVQIDVDVNVEHEEQGYWVRCLAEVAWVAREEEQSPYGQGFGVKFIDPPGDVMILLQRIVRARLLGS